jgi:mannose-6-phosphate isomerase-like protein (cupin superfamily)
MSAPEPADAPAGSEIHRSPLRGGSVGSLETELRIFENVDESPQAPGSGVPLHSHRTEDEAWYVLEGTMRFRYGAREFDATAGSGVLLRHGTPHTFWNPGPGPVRYLLIVRPKTAALLEALHRDGRGYPASYRELFERYDIELLE